MARKYPFNPFSDAGITNYEQYINNPFLQFDSVKAILNKIGDDIHQIKNNYFFSNRSILIGEKGLGKTSCLFKIKDMLENEGIKCRFFSRLIEDAGHYTDLVKEQLSYEKKIERNKTYGLGEESKEPVYILLDFPDAEDSNANKIKKFLDFCWTCFIHKNHQNINIIIALNHTHLDKLKAFGQTYGKFNNYNLHRLTYSAMLELIQARLNHLNLDLYDLFNEEIIEVLFQYSRGIPRNIISACDLLFSELNNGGKINKKITRGILKDNYIHKVIDDRVEDMDSRRILKYIIKVIDEDFDGTVTLQKELIDKVKSELGLGRYSIVEKIKELTKFGVLHVSRGGPQRTQNIISLLDG